MIQLRNKRVLYCGLINAGCSLLLVWLLIYLQSLENFGGIEAIVFFLYAPAFFILFLWKMLANVVSGWAAMHTITSHEHSIVSFISYFAIMSLLEYWYFRRKRLIGNVQDDTRK